jgi:hypothetical protein
MRKEQQRNLLELPRDSFCFWRASRVRVLVRMMLFGSKQGERNSAGFVPVLLGVGTPIHEQMSAAFR